MGTYFNPGNESFKQAIRSQVYVDKTMLLSETNKILNTEQRCIALSHARRFGKSQAAGMIDAYYSFGSDSRKLFEPYKIAKEKDFETYLNKYNVIHVDVASASDLNEEEVVETILKRLFFEFKQEFQDKVDYSQPLHLILNDIYKLTDRKFVIIIDEWDCVVRNQAENQELVHKYLQFLHSLFKSEEAKSFLALAYITGILPIKKIDNESALNNFDEYTMIDSKQFTPYFGFTEDEVKELCQQYDMNFDSVKKWYNGYLINGQHMYNPNSVFRAMVNRKLESYWKNTSAFGTINNYIQLNFDGLKEDIMKVLEGGKVSVITGTFQNDLNGINSATCGVFLYDMDVLDDGCAFEIGFMRANHKPVVLVPFTEHPERPKKMNLMIAQGVTAIIDGNTELEKLAEYDFNWTSYIPVTGYGIY